MKDTRTLLAYPREEAKEVETTLEEHGYEVTVVHSATQALAKVASEPVECVISAYTLSGDDGLSLFRGVREIDEDTPFILFDDTDSTERERAFDAGVDWFVSRSGSASLDKLAETVENATTDLMSSVEKQDITGHEPDTDEILQAVEKAPIGITLTDPSLSDNPVVYTNDAWGDVTGYDTEEILGRNLRILQGPETESESVQALAAAVENEAPVTVTLRNYRRDGSPFWNEVTLAPIHDEDGDIVHYAGFQNDVTKRKETEELAAERAAHLREEKEKFKRILGRVNGLLHQITQLLIEQHERPILAQRICDEIADSKGYAASWMGSTTPTNDTISLESTAGLPSDQPTELSLETLPDPARESIESGRIAVYAPESSDSGCLNVDEIGAGRVAIVPLVYDEKQYGLLGIYGDSPHVLGSREQRLFESIGKMIASRLNAIETAEILTADSVLEVTVAVNDESFPLSQVAAQLGATVEYVGLTNGGENSAYELFLTATNCERLQTVPELPFVKGVRKISEAETAGTFALDIDSPAPFHQLADHGASVAQVEAKADRSLLELELPPDHNVRSIIEILERNYDGLDLQSCQERKHREQTTYEFSSRIDQKLTDRQRATLEAAYMNGYFEWPRPTDGNEIAETMNITRQTFHQHLRAAERKLIETYVEFHSGYVDDRELAADVIRTGRSVS